MKWEGIFAPISYHCHILKFNDKITAFYGPILKSSNNFDWIMVIPLTNINIY